MKQLFTKTMSLLLVLTLVGALFAGCSPNDSEEDNGVTDTTNNDVATTDSTDDTASDDSSSAADTETTEDSATDTSEPASEPTVIRWGTHWLPDIDPYYQDATTGEYVMDETRRQASIAALEAVKEQLNVEIEYIAYATDTRSELITSVLANNPVCDIAVMWGGSESTILSQNILQPLDDYADLFADPQYAWMMYDKMYGHNYFLTSNQSFFPRFPLIFNATLIEAVDALKDDDGNTIYPTDLFLAGDWTWSTFKDYLSKIQTYYANTPSAEGATYDTVQAYVTDHRYAASSAMFAAGGAIYDNGVAANQGPALESAEYIVNLFDEDLMKDGGVYDDGFTPQWCQQASDFQRSATVFTDCPDWWLGGLGSELADRGESMGMVPWPRPDSMSMDDPDYQLMLTVGNSIGILKGVDEETTALAVETVKVFYDAYYKTLAGTDSLTEYKNVMATDTASQAGLDIFNETYGADVLEVFKYIANHTVPNDYSDLLGFRVIWDEIFGKSLYGIDGFASYDVSIEANADLFTAKISEMEAILSSGEIRDNINPSVSFEGPVALPLGTDPASVDFSQYLVAEDAIDGILDATQAAYDYESVDFNTVGAYDDGLRGKIADLSGNEGEGKAQVIIYNPDNTVAPTLTLKADYRTLVLDESASEVNWKDDFVEAAVDADGLDISASIAADISELDTTTPGDYPVVITVTDFAGNQGQVEFTVTVQVEE